MTYIYISYWDKISQNSKLDKKNFELNKSLCAKLF